MAIDVGRCWNRSNIDCQRVSLIRCSFSSSLSWRPLQRAHTSSSVVTSGGGGASRPDRVIVSATSSTTPMATANPMRTTSSRRRGMLSATLFFPLRRSTVAPGARPGPVAKPARPRPAAHFAEAATTRAPRSATPRCEALSIGWRGVWGVRQVLMRGASDVRPDPCRGAGWRRRSHAPPTRSRRCAPTRSAFQPPPPPRGCDRRPVAERCPRLRRAGPPSALALPVAAAAPAHHREGSGPLAR